MKILIDTSVWVNYFSNKEPILKNLLNDNRIYIHFMGIGELALGQMKNRQQVLNFLRNLPILPLAGHEQVMEFVERYQIMGRGIGWVDAHLLVAVALADCQIWTGDKRLLTVAQSLNLAYEQNNGTSVYQ